MVLGLDSAVVAHVRVSCSWDECGVCVCVFVRAHAARASVLHKASACALAVCARGS